MALTIDTTTYRTTNYDRDRNGDPLIITPQGILLHNGGGSIGSDMYELTGKSPRRVSAGYYVTRSGIIYELGPDTHRYWHAGAPDRQTTRWHGNSPAAFGIYDGNLL